MQIASRPATKGHRPRIAVLSTLPIFYTLVGKRVLVSGGSEAAAWKAELLAATGAVVEVATPAEELSEEMEALAGAGQVTLLSRHWTTIGWDGYALAIGDCEDDEAERFASAARRAGVPVNVIDKPACCDFQFGAVVNRSPIVVGISTSGAAPILGQAVRQRIETVLPAELATWAALARRLRDSVTRLLQPGAERRAFWERLAAAAFRENLEDADVAAWLCTAVGAARGRVTLVGAGPGDTEHLTLKALRTLQAADVILFDDTVSDEVLELARREAKRVSVGKRVSSGRDSCRHEDVTQTMIALARAGRHVVRLKSGDATISGCVGEELAGLERHGIAVEVVPGIATVPVRQQGCPHTKRPPHRNDDHAPNLR